MTKTRNSEEAKLKTTASHVPMTPSHKYEQANAQKTDQNGFEQHDIEDEESSVRPLLPRLRGVQRPRALHEVPKSKPL